MRRIRILALLATTLVTLLALQLGATSTASAATSCKQYDGYRLDSGELRRNVKVCAAPAADFPNYSGWGRVIATYRVQPLPCEPGLLPIDIDEPHPDIACTAIAQMVTAWQPTRTGWRQTQLNNLSAAYLAPYAPGWRWAWTAETGWVAVQQRNAAFRWFA